MGTDKIVLVLGTSARGGIRSVIDAYEQSGFYEDAQVRFVPTHHEGGIIRRLSLAASAMGILLKMLLLRRVALLHVHVSMRGSFWRKSVFILMAKVSRVPVLFHLHGSEFASFVEGRGRLLKTLIIKLLDIVDVIVVLSESWRTYVSGLTKTRVVVIGNFVQDHFDPDRAKLEREHNRALFLGQYGERKGIYDLIPAFGRVNQRAVEALLCCGGNGDVQKASDMVNELGLIGCIRILAWVTGPEKLALMHKSAIFVLPSYNEGLPMALIEAMSFSMVVISTRVGGIPELVEEGRNGFLVSAGNQQELEATLLSVFLMPPERIEEMGKESRRQYEVRFTADVALGRMRAIYRTLGVVL